MKINIVETKLVKQYNLEIPDYIINGKKEYQIVFQELIGNSTVEKLALLCLNCEGEIINTSVVGDRKSVV